ncbi:MAG: riboflavin biosynthesis protein RibF [Clostridia bacterium]|nr:riboflavin biosynthesis protein RibF [Clostridia bacterium]
MSGKDQTPTVVALGYFDSVHLGHRKVIEAAKTLADELSASVTVFTFGGNLRAMLSRRDDKFVYSLEERRDILREMGVENIYVQPVDFNFLSMGKLAFINMLNRKFNIKGYVSGVDYKFGKFAKGTTEDIKKFAEANSQVYRIVDTLTEDGKKVSTSRIKTMLSSGDIKGANILLDRPFSVSGTVVKDRGVGRTLGYPTANIKLDKNKQTVKEGVYAGHAFVDGTRYGAVINFGSRPTFGGTEVVLETHIVGFDGDLYGKSLTVYFDNYIREIRKFFSEEDLKKQLAADISSIEKNEY